MNTIRHPLRRWRWLTVWLLLAFAAWPASARETIATQPCILAAPGLPGTVPARCGTLSVAENRARPAGRQIDLALAWVASDARTPPSDPVVLLAGGPGQSALESFVMAAPAFRDVLRRREVLLVDQRGTGHSNPLNCPGDENGEGGERREEGAGPEDQRRFAADCARALQADPRYYTTSDAVLDLEAVRVAIGAEQLNLVGVSYGTRVALEYLRRHPQRVRTLVLDGVVPPTLALGAEHARNLDASLALQFQRCTDDALCATRFGAPQDTLADLMQQLRTRPLTLSYRDPLSHELRDGRLTAERVAGLARIYAYAPQLAAMLPMSLYEALAGRPEVLMAQAGMIESLLGEQFAYGLQLSVLCAEDVDLLKVDPRDSATLLGTDFVSVLLAQCEAWPRGRRPADFHTPVRSAVPALLLSGEYDPVTPPRYGAEVATTLSGGRHLVLRGQGHSVMGAGCAPRLMARFIERADAAALDASCLEQLIRTPPFSGAQGWEP